MGPKDSGSSAHCTGPQVYREGIQQYNPLTRAITPVSRSLSDSDPSEQNPRSVS